MKKSHAETQSRRETEDLILFLTLCVLAPLRETSFFTTSFVPLRAYSLASSAFASFAGHFFLSLQDLLLLLLQKHLQPVLQAFIQLLLQLLLLRLMLIQHRLQQAAQFTRRHQRFLRAGEAVGLMKAQAAEAGAPVMGGHFGAERVFFPFETTSRGTS